MKHKLLFTALLLIGTLFFTPREAAGGECAYGECHRKAELKKVKSPDDNPAELSSISPLYYFLSI